MRLGWFAVCVVPRAVARWLMFGSGQFIPIPGSWLPYLFGRAIGSNGLRLRVAP